MISSAYFLSLEAAMAQGHGTEVGVFAVLASVGPLDLAAFHPYGTRELCLKDSR